MLDFLKYSDEQWRGAFWESFYMLIALAIARYIGGADGDQLVMIAVVNAVLIGLVHLYIKIKYDL